MRSLRAACALGLMLSPAMAAVAQDSPVTKVPILFSVSGAASLGTYQSGATWAILRFLQLANADSTLRPKTHRNIRYEIGALSGTSAGNVNALITGLEWCRYTAIRPESSLFARLWLDVGIGQLNPANDTSAATSIERPRAPGFATAGLLSRAFFDTLWSAITTSMAKPLWKSGCDLPVGITMTRVVPALYALQRTNRDPALEASTQRFVARWRVVSDAASGGATTTSLRPPNNPKDAREFGAEYLIDTTGDGHGKALVKGNIVFDAVQASASVPLVWAAMPLPKPLDANWASRLARSAGLPLPLSRPDSSRYALFVDGGVFDSDPMSLAIDMWNDAAPPVTSSTAHPVLIRIDPGDLRGPLLKQQEAAALAAGPEKQPSAAGLEPVFSLLGGFVPSARDYELQSLGRALALYATNPNAPRIVHSTRAYPAMAQYFHTFSGFLGRPFRDHDFYLGIYDGLRFAAQEFLCSDPADSVATGPAPQDACVGAELDSLVEKIQSATAGGVIPLLKQFGRCEKGGWADSACVFTPDASRDALTAARYALIATLARTNSRSLRAPPPPASTMCGPRACDSFVATLVWGDGFGDFLSSLATDSSYKRAIATIRQHTLSPGHGCWGASAAYGAANGTCPADSAFVALVNDPEPSMNFILEWELRRLNVIENGQTVPNSGAVHAATIAEMLYTPQSYPFRNKFFAPSSVPALEPAHIAWNLAPYYVAGVIGRGGVEAGWDFTLRYFRDAHFGITAPVSIWHRTSPAGERASNAIAAGIGVRLHPLQSDWLGFQLALQYSSERMSSAELAWTPPMLGKIRIGYRSGGAVSIGIQDLPGIAYWARRFF